jgi:CubicO group peptidase (beta-lactamase class C family)
MLHRRRFLAGLAGSSLLPAVATSAKDGPHARHVEASGTGVSRYEGALVALERYVATHMQVWTLPGMVLALTDSDGFTATLTFGWADTERGLPLRPEHLFKIGSISKSIAALCLLTFVDEGKLDLRAPLARYLPDAALPSEQITIEQLLSHSAGLADNPPIFPRVPDGRLWCGFQPGARFSYSNAGYQLLGLLLGKLGNAPHPEVIHRRVLLPLGMTRAKSTITYTDRNSYPVGYSALMGDRRYLPDQPLAPGAWTDEDTAAGCVGATAHDMAVYLRFLLAAGRGRGAPILSDAAAKRFTTALIEDPDGGEGARYALGMDVFNKDGHLVLHHTGGMRTFVSSFHADATAGVACFCSANGIPGNHYRPSMITGHAIELMSALREGRPPAAPADPALPFRVREPDSLLGRYTSPTGAVLTIDHAGGDLALLSDSRSHRLLRFGERGLVTDHPRFESAAFHPVLHGSRVTALWWREMYFAREIPARAPPSSDALRALTGRYESSDPWVDVIEIFARGNSLVTGTGDVLTPRNGYWSADDDPGGVERYRFEALQKGRPFRLNYSGVDLLRIEL